MNGPPGLISGSVPSEGLLLLGFTVYIGLLRPEALELTQWSR